MNEEKQTGLVVEQGSFTLKKIILKPEKKNCLVQFLITKIADGGVTSYEGVLTPDYMANDILQNLINDLKEPLCNILNIQKDKYQNVMVTGLQLGGKEDDRTFKITGTQKSASEQKMKLETHVVHFEEGNYGFEESVRDTIDDIEISAFRYLFANEKAQISAFDNIEPKDNSAEE